MSHIAELSCSLMASIGHCDESKGAADKGRALQ
jgi:hypothetical protein